MPGGEPNLVLPFAVIEREGQPTEEFPLDMTLSAILADLEMTRERAGVLRRREEVLEFASLVYWPIIVTPWREDRHLVFDGMGIWSHVFAVGTIPDARAFAASLDAAAGYRDILSILQSRTTFFDAFTDIRQIPVMGLFIHEEFMNDLLAHATLAKPRELRGNGGALVPRLSPDQAQEAIRKMESLLDGVAADQGALAAAARALESARASVAREIATLRERTIEEYTGRIEAARPDVTSQVTLLETEREERWAAGQPKLLELQAAVRKAEADIQHWDIETKTNYGPDRTDAVQRLAYARGELEWSREEAQKLERGMAQARGNFDREIQAQWDRIREIERERDAEVARLAQEESAAVQIVAKLTNAVAGLSAKLSEASEFVLSQGVPASVNEATVVRMPIVIASFVSERGRRLVVYPPMVARAAKGVLGSLKSTLGGLVLPLEPKTRMFDEVFRGGVERAIAEDPSLAAYLASVGNGNNLLHLANLRELLRQGLAGLRAQGWIRDRHERELIEALERHIALAAPTAPLIEP